MADYDLKTRINPFLDGGIGGAGPNNKITQTNIEKLIKTLDPTYKITIFVFDSLSLSIHYHLLHQLFMYSNKITLAAG